MSDRPEPSRATRRLRISRAKGGERIEAVVAPTAALTKHRPLPCHRHLHDDFNDNLFPLGAGHFAAVVERMRASDAAEAGGLLAASQGATQHGCLNRPKKPQEPVA